MDEVVVKLQEMAKNHGKQMAKEINEVILPLAVKNVVAQSPTTIDDALAGMLLPLIQAELNKLIEKI